MQTSQTTIPSTLPGVRPLRLAYLVSHPIQYQAPLLRRIAQEPDIDLTVFFGSDFSVRGYKDVGFGGVSVKWDIPLLEGYKHVFLPRLRDGNDVTFAMPLNRGIFSALRGPALGESLTDAPVSQATRVSVEDNRSHPAFDVLWVHGYATANALQGILAARLLGIPTLIRAESWLRDRPRGSIKLAFKSVFLSGLGSLIDGVLPIGTLNSEYWRHYLPDTPQFPMPYAVDNAYFAERARNAAPDRAQLQSKLGLDPARPVILFASKLQPRKHCDHLIAAYARLAPARGLEPHSYLVIAGDGEERAALEAQARATGLAGIRFLGFRNQSELPALFDLASVFVLPSRHEPWGLIVNEVMNAGTPCIVSDDVGCAPDLISSEVDGFVYPAGDIDALTDALRSTLASPERATAMGERAFQRIQSWNFEQDIRGLRAALAHVCPGFAG
ncbi:MAG TPA: glycosyltransferase family 4 protein [Acidobacteriaceae bacterium]|nr:glycosyltransferase family 4 protein [Acidobacteriaceae bacterium]